MNNLANLTPGFSIVLGHYSDIGLVPTDIPDLTLGGTRFSISDIIRGELDRIRETLPTSFLSSLTAPLIHLIYHTHSIQMLLREPGSMPSELIAPAMKIVNVLVRHPNFNSPLTHHVTALAAVALVELTKYESTIKEAERGLKILLEGRIAPSAWDNAIRKMIRKEQASAHSSSDISAGNHSLLAAQGLRHLADLATKEGGPAAATTDGATASDESQIVDELPSFGTPALQVQPFRRLRAIIEGGYLSSLIA